MSDYTHADRVALYRVKERGRARVVSFCRLEEGGRDVKGSALDDVLMDTVTHLWHTFSGVPVR